MLARGHQRRDGLADCFGLRTEFHQTFNFADADLGSA